MADIGLCFWEEDEAANPQTYMGFAAAQVNGMHASPRTENALASANKEQDGRSCSMNSETSIKKRPGLAFSC